MAPPSLTLLRHGQSDWNVARRCQGQDDRARLTDVGRAQATEAIDAVRARGVDLVVASDLTRALETADVVAGALGVTRLIDPLVRERAFGYLEGGPLAAMTAADTGIADDVLVDPDARPAGGESFRDVVLRARRFLEKAELAWPDRRLLVVTHGGFVRAARAVISGVALEGMVWERIDNATLWPLEPVPTD
ncbi:MAG TPA: histidine phosphatase family protein [Acidimicrobiales bacterium]|nr:histidine phosphatase family protein [Acidimicrobiales bacterium]